jgi:hypothetical protein
VVTANVTSWTSIEPCFEGGEAWELGEIFLLQETKLDLVRSKEKERWLAARGWCSGWAEANATEAGGMSGGVAVAWKAGLEIRCKPKVVVQGRVVKVGLWTRKWGEMVFYSVYGHVSVQWADVNVELWGDISRDVAEHGKPFVVGGTFRWIPLIWGLVWICGSRRKDAWWCRRGQRARGLEGAANWTTSLWIRECGAS